MKIKRKDLHDMMFMRKGCLGLGLCNSVMDPESIEKILSADFD